MNAAGNSEPACSFPQTIPGQVSESFDEASESFFFGMRAQTDTLFDWSDVKR